MPPDLTHTMNPQNMETDMGTGMGTIAPEPALHRPDNPFGSSFSRVVSLISAALLLSVFGSLLWFSATVPPLHRVEEPDRALDLMVGRMMEAQEELRRLPPWQQRLTEWMVGSNDYERLLAIQWYQELVEATDDPPSKLRLAILQAEEGQEQDVLAEIQTWRELPAPMPLYAGWIEAAYGSEELDNERAAELQATLAEVLPDGWFYRTLVTRLAQRSGDGDLLVALEKPVERQGSRLQDRLNGLLFAELFCVIVGSFALATIIRRRKVRPDCIRLAGSGVPPPWAAEVGTAVLLHGGAMGALITIVFLLAPPIDSLLIKVVAIPLANLPLLILAHVHLLKPAGLDIRRAFGFHIDRDNLGRLAVASLGAIAAGLWGEWVIGQALERVEITNHWTEWFDADLVWGTGATLTVSLLEYLVFAPVFEEFAFRGLLFATLRRRLPFAPAALVSAGIFAAAHGYGVIGFLSVWWSGILWAWVYERTGSLLPGMVAHAANNLFVSLTVMALLR
ncbi:MAG: CPBP family intramembrane metalloprotease [Nitrospira sp.]|nr:CPBP family intramembrane metalloprotease [Nitrospira sp.]